MSRADHFAAGAGWAPDPGPEPPLPRYGRSLRDYYQDPQNGNVHPGDPSRRLYRFHEVHDGKPAPSATSAGARQFMDEHLDPGNGPNTRAVGTHWWHNRDDLIEDDFPHHRPHVIIEASHPGPEHVAHDWDHPTDGPVMTRKVGNRDAANVPEVFVRPGAPLKVHALHFVDHSSWPPKVTRVPVGQHPFRTHA